MNDEDLIPHWQYHKEDHAKVEFNQLFSNSWLFAAMEDELSDNNDFVTVEFFNYPVVIQNFHGNISAFKNICPHRFNKIQLNARGNRPLVCQYHSWSFNEAGKPNTTPLKSKFDTENTSFQKACLTKIALEKVGKFYFINLSKTPLPIKSELGLFYNKIEEISAAITSKHYFEDDLQNVNWKIIIENTLEAYHCPSIHKTSLFSMGFCRIPEENQTHDHGHSVADYPKNPDFQEPQFLNYLNNRTFKHESFRHYFVFPNLLISSTEGKNIYIGNLLPVEADKSVLRKRFYDIKFDTTITQSKHRAYLEIVKMSINNILEEDKQLLEQLQKTIGFANGSYILGQNEQRIAKFHQKYLSIINE
jgi:choline monooxygenase